MEWIVLDEPTVTAHLPSDLAAEYAAWLLAHPDKAGRLAEIVANTVAEVRDTIRGNPANTLDADPTKIPQSCVRHAENIVFFQLAMEMGLDIDTEGNQSMTRADIFLRQISFKRFQTTGGDGATTPSPHYTVPERSTSRVLPLILLGLMALVAPVSEAGWITAPRRASTDAEVTVTYAPTFYSEASTLLFGHLEGIDDQLGFLLAQPTLTGGVKRAGDTMTGPLVLQTLKGVDNQHMTIQAGYAVSFKPDIYLTAGTNGAGEEGQIIIKASKITAAEFRDFYIQGGYHPLKGSNVVLRPGDSSLGPLGEIILEGQTRMTRDKNGQEPRFWFSTNHYLTANGSLTNLFLVTLVPPATNEWKH